MSPDTSIGKTSIRLTGWPSPRAPCEPCVGWWSSRYRGGLQCSWEGFAVEEAVRHVGAGNAYFRATQGGAGLDLLLFGRGGRRGVEVKFADAPGITKSMRRESADLKLDRLLIVYPGLPPYDLEDGARVIRLGDLGRERRKS